MSSKMSNSYREHTPTVITPTS